MTERAGAKPYLMPLALGALSAALYSTVFLSPLFLVPVQAVGARRGHKAMLVSAAVSAAGSGLVQLALTLKAGAEGSAGLVAAGVLAPVALLCAILLLAAPALRKLDFTLRGLLAGAVAALLALPSLVLAGSNPMLRQLFGEATQSAAEVLGTQALDAQALWQTLSQAVMSSFGATLFALVFLSAWLGSRYAVMGLLPMRDGKPVLPEQATPDAQSGTDTAEGQAAPDQLRLVRLQAHPDPVALPPPLGAYRVPTFLVWGLLLSWAAILAGRFVSLGAASAVAWNLAITFSVVYAFQGLAVALALAERAGMATAARAFGPIALVLLIASGKLGLLAMGLLALLGTLETWIPFRIIPKGDKP